MCAFQTYAPVALACAFRSCRLRVSLPAPVTPVTAMTAISEHLAGVTPMTAMTAISEHLAPVTPMTAMTAISRHLAGVTPMTAMTAFRTAAPRAHYVKMTP